MSQPDDSTKAAPENEPLSLEGIELTPDWVKGPTKQFVEPKSKPRRNHHPPRRAVSRQKPGAGPPREPRQSGAQKPRGRKPSAGPPHHKGDRGAPPPRQKRPPQQPLPLEVMFLPEETGLAAMIEKMKVSPIAYALFDLAKLVLGKPQRYRVKIAREVGKDGARPPLYQLTGCEQPFLSREAALRALMQRHLDLAVREIRTEVEPPKGNFTFVNRCGITGAWLGPPNHHQYQANLVRHHQERLRHLSFEKFKTRIETVHDEAALQAWQESLSVKIQYECILEQPAAPAEAAAGESPSGVAVTHPLFDSLADVERHLVENHLDELVLARPELVIDGTLVGQLEHRGIVRSLRQAWERERKFPIKTVNGLRPRLQKAGFHFFKHPDGVVYLTQARLKRFETGALLSDEVHQILTLLRQGGGLTSPQLMAAMLPATEPVAEPARPSSSSTNEPGPVESDADADTAEVVKPAADAAARTAGVATSDEGSEPKTQVAAGEESILAELHWLIDEGYVIELSDGRLWATPEKSPPPAPADPSPSAPEVASTLPKGEVENSPGTAPVKPSKVPAEES